MTIFFTISFSACISYLVCCGFWTLIYLSYRRCLHIILLSDLRSIVRGANENQKPNQEPKKRAENEKLKADFQLDTLLDWIGIAAPNGLCGDISFDGF